MTLQYTEMHIHDTNFTGFKSNTKTSTEVFNAIAISTNPSQIDATPSLMVSGLRWTGESGGVMDVDARYGFQCSDRFCESRTCTLLYDLDGTATSYASGPGQLFNGNRGYSAPYPKCHTASNSDWAMCFAPEKMVTLNTPQ